MGAYIGTVSAQRFDTVVVGGGIIGLATAFVLSREGQRVALVDDAVGRGATYAAAGMLAPGAESSPEHSLFASRALAARDLWPQFVQQLNQSASSSCELFVSGTVFVGWDADDRREWRRYFDTAHEQGIKSLDATRDLSPDLFLGLSPRTHEAQFVHSDAYVDTDDIVRGLRRALDQQGVVTYAHRALHCDVKDGEAITEIAGDTLRSRCGILATGYQGEPLEILNSSIHRLRPVRGVTLRLRADVQGPLPMIRAYVNGRHVYVVRRTDGTVLVGASSDESADLTIEAGAIRRLLEDAATVSPELDEATFVEARVGLRPASSDQTPFFDELADGAWAWSAGHYRHGFLMAPLAANDALAFSMNRLK